MEIARNIRTDKVARLQSTPPRQLDASANVADAVALMQRDQVGCLMVVRSGKLVGLVTERDFLTRIRATGKPLSVMLGDVMTPEPVTIRPQDSVRIAMKRMQQGGYRHLPVVDAENRPVGMLSA
ncbi:MAG: CBS domain-containing protein, partial [Gemmataceae bacterium]